MKNSILYIFILLPFTWLSAQGEPTYYPENDLDTKEIRTQLEFLASDFLQGRRTNSLGNETAAAFLAAHLKAYGYETPEGQNDYFQQVPLAITRPPEKSSFSINDQPLTVNEDYLILSGPSTQITGKAVFAGHGWIDTETDHNDYAGLDVKGKVVFVLPGAPGAKDPGAIFEAMAAKRKFAQEQGATALFEMYQLPFPWAMFANYFGGESMRVEEDEKEDNDGVVYGWLNKMEGLPFETIQTSKKLNVHLESEGVNKEVVTSSNVIGVLAGSDPELRDEYILLTAHYDHVGVGVQGGNFTEQDSIFNGARDNGMGVVALLAAAKSLSEMRPDRSIIILALTGEEVGLLGSKYYANHPLIPLEQVVFNLNTDGAGYTDTTAVAIVGWGRTGTDELMTAGAAAFDLKIIANPVPEMQLFDRSDNVSFAAKGVPCLSISPGFSEFSDELMKNYHQVSDDTEDINWNYLTKYCQTFAHSARLLAKAKTKPQWKEGDKYEAEGKELYGY